MPLTSRLLTVLILLTLVAFSAGISCWKCGTYSDGVGSITPCNNRNATHLIQCPNDAKFCIKYVSELTVVRDCVPTCTEREWWGARTFCCDTDECNSGFSQHASAYALAVAVAAALVFAR